MSEQNIPTRNELEAKIIAKAWQDEAFKQELFSNPTATVIRELNLKHIPENVEIKIVEENPNTLYMVIPMKPVVQGEELSEQELEAVAGGLCGGLIKTVVKTVSCGLSSCL